jgi:hypothetical protein
MTDELADLRALVRLTAPPDPEFTHQARSRLMDLISHSTELEQSTATRPKLPTRSRRIAGVIATCALVGIAAFAVPNVGGPPKADAAAAVFLNQLSDVAARQNSTTTHPDRYAYQRWTDERTATLWITGRGIPVRITQEWELWTAPDGSGRQLERPATLQPVNQSDSQLSATPAFMSAAKRLGDPANDNVVPAGALPSYGGTSFAVDNLAALPLETTQLRSALVQAGVGRGNSEAQQLFETVYGALTTPGLPPALRAALLKVAATIPGLVITSDRARGSQQTLMTITGEGGGSVTVDPLTALVTARYDSSADESWSRNYLETAANVISITVRPDGTKVPRQPYVTPGS